MIFKINSETLKNLMKSSDVKTKDKKWWINMIHEYPFDYYEKSPFKDDPEVKQEAKKTFADYLFNHPEDFIPINKPPKLPKEMLNDKDIHKAVEMGWANKINKNPTPGMFYFFILSTEPGPFLRKETLSRFQTLNDKTLGIIKSIHEKIMKGEEPNEEETEFAQFTKTIFLGSESDLKEEKGEEAKKEIENLPTLTVDKILDMYNKEQISKEQMEQMMKTLRRESYNKLKLIINSEAFKKSIKRT